MRSPLRIRHGLSQRIPPPALALALAIALASGALAEPRIADGDFDRADLALAPGAAPGPWVPIIHRPGEGRFTIARGEGRAGTTAARFEKTDPTEQNAHLDQIIDVPTNAFLEVAAWMRGDGHSSGTLAVCSTDWRQIAAEAARPSGEWSETRIAFHSGENGRIRLCWHPNVRGDIHRSGPGTNRLDDVTITPLKDPPERLRRALDLARPRPDALIEPASVRTAPIGRVDGIRPIACRNGTLCYPDGSEVALWGVNFQTALSWEYNGRLARVGVPPTAEALKKISDDNLAEIRAMGCDVIRLHLCPSDFSDAEGNVRDSIYLDALDHLMARAHDTATYVYLTLINDMGQRPFPDTFMAARGREEWLTDPAFVDRTERFIRAFLSREGRYTKRRYADDPAIAVIEIMNEPGYPDWPRIVSDPALAASRASFDAWRARSGPDGPHAAASFRLWRHETVSTYLARMCAAIRATGAPHPIIWNLNWPRFIEGREDVFNAVADSPVDGISFCLYPGQQDTKHPFWAHPINLDDRNYLPFLREQYMKYDRLRWLLGQRFAKKAKVVYEFETFYTQNSFLYPAMARLFRSLGAQIAPMWTYSLTPYAEYFSGSHHLNLYCTPQKAASFAIASEIFRATPRLAPYPTQSTDELSFDGCTVSAPKNLSILTTDNALMHSRPVADLPEPTRAIPRRILAVGSSPLVTFEGTGIYRMDITDHHIDLAINPDAAFVLPHWQKQPAKTWAKTCALDPAARHRFITHIPGWGTGVTVQRVEGQTLVPVPNRGPGPDFDASPGRYRIERR